MGIEESSGRGPGGREEVLREALQHAAGVVDGGLFGGVEATGHRHLEPLAIATMNHQRERRAWRAVADDVVGLGAVQAAVSCGRCRA